MFMWFVKNKCTDQFLHLPSLISAITTHFVDSTVKPVLSSHFKTDKIKVLIANISLGAFCNTFDSH